MSMTKVFSAVALADAKIAEVRARLRGHAAVCRVVCDDQDGAALAYAARLTALGRQAGVRVIQIGYEQIDALLAAPADEPVVLLHPAPKGVDVAMWIEALGPARDAEGLHPVNAGKLSLGSHVIAPPTAQAAFLVAEHLMGPLTGVRVAIVGASSIVGLPLALLMIHAGATVRVAQASTRDLVGETREADVVISATGVPGLITADHIGAGAVVIDVGVTRVGGALRGDVDQLSVQGKAAVVTHVPDGVGPLTAACLFENVATLIAQNHLHGDVEGIR